MSKQKDIKAFVEHCKDVAWRLDSRNGTFHHVELLIDGGVFVEYNTWTEEYYAVEITPYLNATIEQLCDVRKERERLKQERIEKHLEGLAAQIDEQERKEYERLKDKFEPCS